MTEEAFGPRVRELGEQAQALRAHQAEVAAGIAATHSGRLPSAEDLLVVHRQLREALGTAPDTVRKAIAQAFVDELYVEARDRILPTYRVLAGIPDQPERPAPATASTADSSDNDTYDDGAPGVSLYEHVCPGDRWADRPFGT